MKSIKTLGKNLHQEQKVNKTITPPMKLCNEAGMGDSGRENPRSLHSNFLNCSSHNDPILVVDLHTRHIWYSPCSGCPINESKFITQRCHGQSHRVQFSWSVQPLCKYNRASKKFWDSWVFNVGTAGFRGVFSLLRYYNLGPPWWLSG